MNAAIIFKASEKIIDEVIDDIKSIHGVKVVYVKISNNFLKVIQEQPRNQYDQMQ